MQEPKIIEKGSLEHRLLECCRNGAPEEVRALVDAGADVNAQMPIFEFDSDLEYAGYSIVHFAAENPDIRIIKLLVERGADVNVKDVYDDTPLYYAAGKNTLDMVKYLVSLGNDPLHENLDGGNLLTVSACNPHKDVLEYFLQQGVDIEGVSDVKPLGNAMRYGTPADMDFFIEHGANKEDALANAYCGAPLENIRHLLEKGCNVNAVFGLWDGERLDWTKLTDGPLLRLFLEYGAKSDEELAEIKKKDAPQNDPELVLMIGIPGSGKSTFCQKHFPEYERISLDVLRTRKREATVLEQAIASHKNCVVDNTNVSAAERAKFIAAGKHAGYRIVGYYMRSKIDECLKRNAMRSGKTRVPDQGVIGRAALLELPKYAEGFDELHYVTITDAGFDVSDWKEDRPCVK